MCKWNYNNMIEQRRRQFKCEIRRKHLDAIIKQARIKLIQSSKLKHYVNILQNSQLSKDIASSLQCITRALKSKDQQSVRTFIFTLIRQVKASPEETSFSLMVNSKQIKYIFRKVIKNKQYIAEGDGEWQPLQQHFQLEVIQLLFHLVAVMNFKEIREEDFIIFLQAIWQILQIEYLNIYRPQYRRILNIFLKALKQMTSFSNKIVMKIFKQFNLIVQIGQIINESSSLSLQSKIDLLEILHTYIKQQLQTKTAEDRCEIDGITILGQQNSQNEIIIRFCCHIINNKVNQGYQSALSVMIIIFETQHHLIRLVHKKTLTQIINLIPQYPIYIQKKAIELISDMITNEQQIGDMLLENNCFADVLLLFISENLNKNDKEVNTFSYIVGVIMSNLTLGYNKKGIQVFKKHRIWKFSLESIRYDSVLFPLVGVFQYFQQMDDTALQDYIYRISQVNFEGVQKRQYQSIRRTFQRVYLYHKQKEEMNNFALCIMEKYRLLFLLNDLELNDRRKADQI